jgi:glyoxylase-like metal-dependent hydrolase (beta-lactamase superfamily II)
MDAVTARSGIEFPFPEPPAPGAVRAVAPGILWLRLPLPFQLDHVNVYLIEDDGGWAVLDTGIGDAPTKAAWEALLAGQLQGQRITRIICSHFHPDHMGLVGWLTRRCDCPLFITRTEFLTTKVLENSSFAANPQFYAQHGLSREAGGTVAENGHAYLRLVTGLPLQYHRLQAGGTLRIGGRDFAILTGGGHSPEQAMLHCASDNIFLAVDQVLTRISPNVSVQAMEPQADSLGDYLASLAALRTQIPAQALVLPGHHLPFTGLHDRLTELAAHHAARCALIAEAAAQRPLSAADLVPVLFKRNLDLHQTGFAFGETMAHINYMLARGDLVEELGSDGILRVRKQKEDVLF